MVVGCAVGVGGENIVVDWGWGCVMIVVDDDVVIVVEFIQMHPHNSADKHSHVHII